MTAQPRGVPYADERSERRCRMAPSCPCQHQECRDGWLDDPGHWDTATRCPVCWAAFQARADR